MNVIVLTKHVPNPSGNPPEIGPDFRLRRETGEGGTDPAGEPAVAIGRRLVDEAGGAVIALSMGPERAVRTLAKVLATGADRAILVTDDALEGADALATARVLAAAIERQPFDLVIAGIESSDGATGTMPMALAELLGIPAATFARQLLVKDGSVVIERQTEAGYDVIECVLPALVTVTSAVAEPRYPSVRAMIQAKKKPIERLSLADLGRDPDLARPMQAVAAIEFGLEKQAGELIENADEAPARVVRFLHEAKVA
ncbi:MAG: electron transfer flavoprotein subunit beta/FixA family protein [Solirubrobacteraceae bacterium]